MVRLIAINLHNCDDLLNVEPLPEQEQYSCAGKKLIPQINNESIIIYGIYINNVIVGYFYLDFNDIDLKEYSTKQYCTLKALTIDAKKQKQGFAKLGLQQLLSEFSTLHPNCEEILLSVNCKDNPTMKLYENIGFTSADQLYLGGKAGPQYVFYFSVNAQ